ncbi:hypothetical protein IFM89_008281 [Coptis chinensis]|uniref:Uncharacterized protein n=1 Tax=Coptis chinensis TaxID=261450 RepID=A0A835GVB3_9MAGN|nr:hypothetical protein IFM89_008281 [Coptis chinensis]
MKLMMKTFLAIYVGIAITLAILMTTAKRGEEDLLFVSTKRVSRFLAQKEPRHKYHCKKDADVCYLEGSPGSTCCNNKCIDIKTDNKNCGACKNKCKYTDSIHAATGSV